MIETQRVQAQDADRSGFFIHAVAVVVAEKGILIRGASGAGKSRLALTLVSMAETRGYFARLVGDDRIRLERSGGRVIARGHPTIQGAIEWRGQGIFETSFLDAVVLGLVIDLVSPESRELPRCPEDDDLEIVLEGVNIPAMALQDNVGAWDQAAAVLRIFRFQRKKISAD
jgi:serine kinase of HPr protein (carbohydrate metabolism regulator)